MGIKTGTPTTEANGGKATPGGNSGNGETVKPPTAPTGPTQAETDAAQNATSQSTQFVSGTAARLGDGQLTPNRGFDAGSSTDAGSSQGASQDDDWRNAPPMGVTADNRIEPNQVLDEATRQVEGDWEFYDRAGEVLFVVATTVFTGGAAWFGRGAVVGKTGTGATAATGAGLCFAAGTEVHTRDGLKPIEEVAVGDLVWTKDEKTGELSLRPVVRTFVTPDQELLQVVVESADGQTDDLRTTGEHPFWTKAGGWVPAAQLQPGDEILQRSGDWLRVTTAIWLQEQETVYNFEVDDFHTYFVGTQGAWVHNTCVDIAREVISKLSPGLFKPLQCTNCATAMAAAIKARGVSGQILNIRAGAGDFIASDLVKSGTTSITRNGFHQAVRVGDTVFDNYFPGGVSYDTYIKALHAVGGVTIKAVGF